MSTDALNDLVKSRLSPLEKKSFAELSPLEAYQGEKVKQGGKTVTVSVWKDMLGDRELRIVVQVYRHLFFGIGRMAADGFRIGKDGTVQKLSKEELYEFS
jgi:hypothetical protein